MTTLTHVLVTTAGVQAANLQGSNLILAYIFGTLLDLDHIIKLPLYLKKYGLRKERYYHWRTSLQEPIASLWIIPLCFFLQTYVPLVFAASHIVLDYFTAYKKYPFSPFSRYSTRGFLAKIPSYKKEAVVIALFLCLNLLLVLIK